MTQCVWSTEWVMFAPTGQWADRIEANLARFTPFDCCRIPLYFVGSEFGRTKCGPQGEHPLGWGEQRHPMRRPQSITASAAPASPAAPAAKAPAPLFLRTGFIDRETAPLDFFAVESSDGGLRFRIASHFHETESFGPTRVPVHDHLRRFHRAVCREDSFEITITDTVAQITHI